jgi:hypothetical protein
VRQRRGYLGTSFGPQMCSSMNSLNPGLKANICWRHQERVPGNENNHLSVSSSEFQSSTSPVPR